MSRRRNTRKNERNDDLAKQFVSFATLFSLAAIILALWMHSVLPIIVVAIIVFIVLLFANNLK